MSENKNNVPKRRFKEFENAEDWEQLKLGEISDSFEYGLNAAATEFDGVNKYIRITDIDDESRSFLENDLTSPNVDLSNADNYKLKSGDILFARTGASVGKSYIYNVYDGLVYYAGFLIRARIKPEYDAEFVFQNTLTNKYNKYIRITSQRSGQPGVNAQEYAEFKLRVPEYDEQSKIGLFFKQLDNLITLHQRKLEKMKALKKAYLTDMFPAEGERKPKLRFAGFTDDWEQRKLGEICEEFQSGKNIKAEDIKENGDYPVYGGNGFRGYSDTYNHDGIYALIGRQGALCGNMNISSGKAYFTEHAIAVRANKSSETRFLFYLLGKMNLGQYSGQSAQPGLAVNKLLELSSAVPNYDEQKQISEFFVLLDHLITLHQHKLEKLQNTKKAYLNEMFI